jgi:hypothetical protein
MRFWMVEPSVARFTIKFLLKYCSRFVMYIILALGISHFLLARSSYAQEEAKGTSNLPLLQLGFQRLLQSANMLSDWNLGKGLDFQTDWECHVNYD